MPSSGHSAHRADLVGAVCEASAVTDLGIRAATSTDSEFLVDMLVEAMNWLPERNWSREQILANPALAHYVTGWMQPNDFGLVAVDPAGRPVGAAWFRYLTAADPGYGYVSDDVPELTIGVVETWRGRGVGGRFCALFWTPHENVASALCR